MKRYYWLIAISLILVLALVAGACAKPSPSSSAPPTTQKPPATTAAPAASPTPSPTQKPATSAAPTKVIVWKLSHGYPATHMRQTMALKLKELVEKETGGRMTLEIYPAAQLYSSKDELPALKMNAVQITFSTTGVVGNVVPSWQIMQAGWFKSVQARQEWEDKVGNKVLAEEVEKAGWKQLAFQEVNCNGMVITNAVRPIKSAADMQGLKVRTPTGRIWEEKIKFSGASPISIVAGELPTALQQKLVDGEYSSDELMYVFAGWKMGQKYITTFGEYHSSAVVGSLAAWKELPGDLQDIWTNKIIPPWIKFMRDTMAERGKEVTNGLKTNLEYIQWTPEETKTWYTTTLKPMYDWLIPAIGNAVWNSHLPYSVTP